MKQNLLKSFMTVVLFVCASVVAMAQTIYGARTNSSEGVDLESFELSEVNSETPAAVTKLHNESVVFYDEFSGGTSLGNKYYAFFTDNSYNYCLGTFNFTDGTAVKVKTFKQPMSLYDMTSSDDMLYGLRLNESDYTGTDFFKIDPKTGELTVITTFSELDGTYDAFTADGKGGFYLLHNEMSMETFQCSPVLYSIGADNTLEKVAEWPDITYMGNDRHSMTTLEDGTLVLVYASSVYVIDPAAKTMVKKGTLAHGIKGITAVKSTENGEAATGGDDEEPEVKAIKKIVRTTAYGDHMSTTTDATKATEYYYDKDLKTSRVIELGRLNGQSDFGMTYFNKYTYNEEGNQTAYERYQVGLYDLGEKAMNMREKNEFDYNENGQLIEKRIYNIYSGGTERLSRTYNYTYYEDGSLESESYELNGYINTTSYMYDDGYKVIMTTSAPKDKPENATTTIETIMYDENGNIMGSQVEKMVMSDDPDDPMVGTEPVSITQYTYDETGFLTEKLTYKYQEGMPVPSSKTVFEAVNGDVNVVMHSDSTYNSTSEKWTGNGQYYIDEYADFSDVEANITSLAASVVEGSMNDVKLDITVPSMDVQMQPSKIKIYRDGELLKTVDPIGDCDFEFDNDTYASIFTYTDEKVPNGNHDYFVQLGYGPHIDWFAEGDETDEPVEEGDEYKFFIVSNPQNVILDTEIPSVTNLEVASAEEREFKDQESGASGKAIYAAISWTNPEKMEDYGFISNSIYMNRMQLPESSTTEATANSLEVPLFEDDECKVYVVTRYAIGKAFSDTITVKYDDLKELVTGIKNATASGVSVKVANKVLSMDGAANVAVFSLSGQAAAKANNVNTLDMSELKNGTYVIAIEKNGKVSTYKVILK